MVVTRLNLRSVLAPSVLLYVKPLIRLKNVTTFDLDDFTSTILWKSSEPCGPECWAVGCHF